MVEKDFKIKYNSSCRVCLLKSNDGVSLFSTKYQSMYLFDMMSSCTTLEIKQGDALPSLICTKCLKSLIEAYDFQKQCQQTDRQLRIELDMALTTTNQEIQIAEVNVKMPILSISGFDIAIKNEESDCVKSAEILEINLPDQQLDINSMGENNVALKDPFDVKPEELINRVVDELPCEGTEAILDSSKSCKDKNLMEMLVSGRKTEKMYQCSVCNRGFNKSFNLQRHFRVHRRELANHCSNIIIAIANPNKHTATVIDSSNDGEDKPPIETAVRKTKKVYQCLVCKQKFNKSFNLKRHFNVHKKELSNHYSVVRSDCENEELPASGSKTEKKLQCPLCQKWFNKAFNLQRHSKVHNDLGKPFECEICKFRFASEILLIRHALQHTDLSEAASSNDNTPESSLTPPKTYKQQQCHPKYKCKYCEKTFSKLHQLRRHFVMSHDVFKPHKCNVCDQNFALASQLAAHISGHNDEKPFVCRLCNKGFQNSNALKAHMKTHCKETPFLCSECGKAFQNKSNLSQHMIRHSGYKPFACKECPSRFITKGALKAHMSTHTQIKPFACDLCGATFTRNYSVIKHKRDHHRDERPFPCELCVKRFHTSERLRIHVRTHTGEKPFKCNFCDRAFAQKNDLVKHTRSHVGDNTYKCKDCPAAFRLFRELQNHSNMHFLALKNSKIDVTQANLSNESAVASEIPEF